MVGCAVVGAEVAFVLFEMVPTSDGEKVGKAVPLTVSCALVNINCLWAISRNNKKRDDARQLLLDLLLFLLVD